MISTKLGWASKMLCSLAALFTSSQEQIGLQRPNFKMGFLLRSSRRNNQARRSLFLFRRSAINALTRLRSRSTVDFICLRGHRHRRRCTLPEDLSSPSYSRRREIYRRSLRPTHARRPQWWSQRRVTSKGPCLARQRKSARIPTKSWKGKRS